MAEKPKFGIVDYKAKKQLQITCSQYLYLYAISQMDGLEKFGFWCIAPNDYFADMLDMSVRGVQKMNKLLIHKGLIKKGSGSQKRATDKFKSTLLDTNKVHPSYEQSSPLSMNKVHPNHEQSSPYNNKISIVDNNKINNNSDFDLFWDQYHKITASKKGPKDAAFKHWKKLNKSDKAKAIEMIGPYSKTVSESKYIVFARTYLADKRFNDEYEATPTTTKKKTYFTGR